MKFTGKNVLITGSSRGIGADIAKVLAKMGLKVWINIDQVQMMQIILKKRSKRWVEYQRLLVLMLLLNLNM